jgi:hypothetical protein
MSYLNMNCPSGGTFSICTQEGSSNFIGCCEFPNPCESGCPDSQIQPTSFNASFFGSVPDQNCEAGALFYQCAETSPPFWGCCKSNPCTQNNCPHTDLSPATISSNPANYSVYLGSLTNSNSPSPAASGTTMSTRRSSPTLIISATLGSIILLCITVAVLFIIRRRRSLKNKILVDPNHIQVPVKPSSNMPSKALASISSGGSRE